MEMCEFLTLRVERNEAGRETSLVPIDNIISIVVLGSVTFV